ncbi:MAG: hypothetical protein K2J63_12925 [Muribaculaceae bacterium]|nr:hypothetical protein [Muribaculaceae bacterium]
MKRNLFTQMRFDWLNNLWLIIGLTIISLTIWYFSTSLLTILRNYFTPLGFDKNDVYVMEIGRVRGDAPDFIPPSEDNPQQDNDDLKSLLAMIRENPNVEAAGFSDNATPFSWGYNGNKLFLEDNDTIGYHGNERRISPEVVKVLRLQSYTGKDLDYLQSKLEAGEILVAHTNEDIFLEPLDEERRKFFIGRRGDELNGKNVRDYGGRSYHVADLINLIRSSAYEEYFSRGGIVYPIDESGPIHARDILVRVKPGCGNKFYEEYISSPEHMRRRNIYLQKPVKLTDMEKSMERRGDVNVRLYSSVIILVLIIVLLGLFGTFWFRVQQRVGEIAIRRVCGASRSDIFRRLIGEGMILFVGACLLTALIGWYAIGKLNLDDGFSTTELVWLEVATMALVAVGIVLSILGPAWMAMRINPAEAVKDE